MTTDRTVSHYYIFSVDRTPMLITTVLDKEWDAALKKMEFYVLLNIQTKINYGGDAVQYYSEQLNNMNIDLDIVVLAQEFIASMHWYSVSAKVLPGTGDP